MSELDAYTAIMKVKDFRSKHYDKCPKEAVDAATYATETEECLNQGMYITLYFITLNLYIKK